MYRIIIGNLQWSKSDELTAYVGINNADSSLLKLFNDNHIPSVVQSTKQQDDLLS